MTVTENPARELFPPRTADTLSFGELGIDVAVELIGGEVATEYLRFNTKNRKPKDLQINTILGAILRDEWMLNGEAIVFSVVEESTGRPRLLDGQNRLRSVEEAAKQDPGVRVPVLVVRGIDPDALYTMDGVVKRSVADALHLEGYTNQTNLAAAANLIYCWGLGENALRSKSRHRMTTPQAVQFVKDHDDVVQASREAERIHRRMVGLAPQSLVAACWWKFAQINETDCASFFGSLASGENLRSGDPVYALRRILNRNRQSTVKRNSLVLHAWIIKAWNYHRDGQRVEQITWRSSEPFPEPV